MKEKKHIVIFLTDDVTIPIGQHNMLFDHQQHKLNVKIIVLDKYQQCSHSVTFLPLSSCNHSDFCLLCRHVFASIELFK